MIHEDGKSEVREGKGPNSLAAEDVRKQFKKEVCRESNSPQL